MLSILLNHYRYNHNHYRYGYLRWIVNTDRSLMDRKASAAVGIFFRSTTRHQQPGHIHPVEISLRSILSHQYCTRVSNFTNNSAHSYYALNNNKHYTDLQKYFCNRYLTLSSSISTSSCTLTPSRIRSTQNISQFIKYRVNMILTDQILVKKNKIFRLYQFYPNIFPFSTFSSLSSRFSSLFHSFQTLSPRNLVYLIILLNVLVFLLWHIYGFPSVKGYQWMNNNFTISLDNLLSGRVHTLVTSAFSQIQFHHLLFNCIALYSIAIPVGELLGNKRFLILYFGGAIAAAATHVLYENLIMKSRIPALGASGSVMGCIVYFGLLQPDSIFLVYFVPVRAKYLVLGLVAYDLFLGIFPPLANDRTAHFAHLGGAGWGAILYYIWNRRKGRGVGGKVRGVKSRVEQFHRYRYQYLNRMQQHLSPLQSKAQHSIDKEKRVRL